jgi:hypothetical protein
METANKESPIMSYSANPEFPIMEIAIMESPIMSYSANPETYIMETAIKESPIKSTQENTKSGETLRRKNHFIGLNALFILWDWFELSKRPLDMIKPY